MRRARTSAASSAAALLYSVGMPIMISRAFVPHIPHSTRHCQLHPVQLHLSAKKVPSFKPAWDSPRRIPVGARRNPGATTEAARDVDSAASVVATAAADARAVSEEAVAGDDATSSTTRPRPKTYSYSKAAWRPSPVSNERKGGGSSSNSALETPAALKQSASTTAVPSDATAAPATTAPTTPGASSAAATPSPPRPALEAVAVPPTRSEPVQSPTAAAAAGVDEATVETPAASSTLAEPPATPTMPLKPSGGGSAAAEAIAISLRQVKDVLAPFSKKIQDNIAEGTFGERGEEWAILQVVILLCVGLGTVPLVGGLVTTLAGPGLAAVGIAVAAAGASGLGQSLSPWPAPVKDNHLKTDGIFGIIRHPAYTGLVMFCLGFGVMTDSPLRMLLAVLLGVVLDKKVEKDEKMLVDMHGEAYEEYISKVAKFLPGVY